MLKRVVLTMLAAAFAVTASAQPKPVTQPDAKAETKKEAPVKSAPEPPGLPFNVRIEVSITDQSGSGNAARKVVTMIAADRQNTNIRSSASVPVRRSSDSPTTFMRDVTINVDARPAINQKDPSKISLNLGLEYFPKMQTGSDVAMEAGMASFSERMGLILESGKPMMISQAADPTSERKITVEVTATILK